MGRGEQAASVEIFRLIETRHFAGTVAASKNSARTLADSALLVF
jgi:hypothetical protein